MISELVSAGKIWWQVDPAPASIRMATLSRLREREALSKRIKDLRGFAPPVVAQ
ncbi:hypothetical protein [Nevskia soli]|uniref:hypothetical protein n=1 Tax=Nevskia soli TaxID=418856 RepID=UPI0012FC48EC|nr:hypothetical protein [Nevskia soli]